MDEATATAVEPGRRPRGVATLAELASFDEIIDVRSPAEFADDRVPGSISCPVLDDEERREIGTLYKQVSPFVARRRGAAYVTRNIARHLLEQFPERERDWRPLVLCWRGGQRSAAMTTVLRSVGWDACQLQGGYKIFRRHVVEQLAVLPARFTFCVVEGATGSGKTLILHEIARQGGAVLDLEGLACHRGSVLGGLPEQGQPSQKWFETRLWQALAALDPARPVFVEGESRKIGRLRVPESLFAAMRAARRVEVRAQAAARVTFLLTDYAHFLADPARLSAQLDTLRSLLGNERVAGWQALVDRGDFAGLTAALLHEHYDPLYARARRRNGLSTPEFAIDLNALDGAEIARAAAEIRQWLRDAMQPVASS